ncbi:MAG TPA: tyrosine--tRNA ligase [Candidatus Angelobacter sp.]|nr:tyrosine--tRNA ligase [Candidatus Angelobacter sp.]
MNILEELEWRGLVADCTDRVELDKKLGSAITLYCGFDPSADSLHVGNLVPLLALRRFQMAGHHPIAVAGGATGSIGDPSGKTQERQLLTKEILERNIASLKTQLARLLDFNTKTNPARLVDNASWTANIGYLDFLRDTGKHFSVNQMIQKESVRARMEDRETGISYTEFSYMLLQAFDFYVLARDCNCELQIGGSDQWGNITAGIDLCRKKLGKQVYGLTLPLITNADGTKFGKTEAGAVWLDPKRTREDEFYQFWIRTDDRDVIRYLKYFTFLSREEIEPLESQHKRKPEARAAHKALAQAVTDLVHPPVKSLTGDHPVLPRVIAESVSGILFGKLFQDYTEADYEFLATHNRSVTMDKSKLQTPGGILLIELLLLAGLCTSRGQARRDIEGKSIYLGSNHSGVLRIDHVINPGFRIEEVHFVFGKYLLLRKGKRNYVVVTAK